MKNSTKPCVLCGNIGRSLLYSQNQWKVYRCDHCGLGVLDPRPDDAELCAGLAKLNRCISEKDAL